MLPLLTFPSSSSSPPPPPAPEGYNPIAIESSRAMSGGGVRKTLSAMSHAHKLLMSQVCVCVCVWGGGVKGHGLVRHAVTPAPWP